MSKRRKRLALIACGIFAVGLTWVLLVPREREPSYQGRKLSQWLAIYRVQLHYVANSRDGLGGGPTHEFQEAQNAVRCIGTNALPYFLKWIRYEPPTWRTTLRLRLPLSMPYSPMADSWLEGAAARRAMDAYLGIRILGTNAISAIPVLELLMQDSAKTFSSTLAIHALGSIGESSIPTLTAALADPRQADRSRVVYAFRTMAYERGTNICLPTLVELLNDEDVSLRTAASNVLQYISPGVLTNSPPH